MEQFINWLHQPWPWYVAGPIIGLSVPALLILGNKQLGISATLHQICAACFPGNVEFLKINWKKDSWNLFFAAGILIGGFLAGYIFSNPNPVALSSKAIQHLKNLGIQQDRGLMPLTIFNWHNLFSIQGLFFIVIGGFFVGFGTRYAGGCTSGHGIFGLSTLQWTSLVALIAFFVGGIIASWFLLPYILKI